MAVDLLLGLQWGDEGKGKIVDVLTKNYDIIARFQGGPNAGHTIKIADKKYVLHTVPSGVFRENIQNVIGNGVVLDPVTLLKELEQLDESGIEYRTRLFISQKAHLILPTHRYLDAASEAAKGKQKIGSTLKGIGPTYMDKTGRNGLRVGDLQSTSFQEKYNSLKEKHLGMLKLYPEIEFDLEGEEAKWMESVEVIKSMNIINGEYFINKAIKEGKKILAEGAQGSMLDVDFGTYPFVTSSNTITSGVCNGLGVAPSTIREVIGIAKAYCTRVGSGPFPSELDDEVGEKLRRLGSEFGATTGRPRRCGWNDIPQLLYTIMLNGVTQIVMTKLDILDEFESIVVGTHYQVNGGEPTKQLPFDLCDGEIKMVNKTYVGWNQSLDSCDNFEDLPMEAKSFVSEMSTQLGVPISMVSTGPERRKLMTVPR